MALLIGTAGHVDHGKTTLIHALTGIDADRLPEEKSRGMTIDIGFAYLSFPQAGQVSMIDVPGHEKFATNMLVGAMGIDVGLLVVAADEGVMPQTREHLLVLDLLPTRALVVALTRADLAEPEMREIVAEDVRELLKTTRFQDAPILPVASPTGEGIPELKAALEAALLGLRDDTKTDTRGFVLPIDRAFTLKGHGVVITGTLVQGHVAEGDRVWIDPGRLEARVRSLHVHGQSVGESERGRRTALNLSGVRLEDLRRGQLASAPGAAFETTMIDARVRWVGKHRHGQNVRVSVGAEEAIGRLYLNDQDPELVQIRFERPIACARHQPLIIRRYSPPEVLAGGVVETPQAVPRRKKERVNKLRSQDRRTSILELLKDEPGGVPTSEICRRLGATSQELGDLFEQLRERRLIFGFAGLWFDEASLNVGANRFLDALQESHRARPTVAYHPREAVVAKAGLKLWTGKPLDRILSWLDETRQVAVQGTGVRLATHQVELTPRQRQLLDRVMSILERDPVNLPYVSDLAEAVNVPKQAVEEILKVALESGDVVRVAEGLYYTQNQLRAVRHMLQAAFGGRKFTAGEAKEALKTTRKYVIPLLEHLDTVRFTVRLGDERMIRR